MYLRLALMACAPPPKRDHRKIPFSTIKNKAQRMLSKLFNTIEL